MNAFGWARPRTAAELSTLLAAGNGVRLMAGGTDLLDELKSGVVRASVVADLASVEGLAGIAVAPDGSTRIGAMTTLAALARDPRVAAALPGLRDAALSVGTPQLRNAGTVGGNLCQRPRCWYYRDPETVCRKKGGRRCFAEGGRDKYHAIFGGAVCHAVHPSDLAPMLLALGASVVVAGPGGESLVPVAKLYHVPLADVRSETTLGPGEFVKAVIVPAPAAGLRSAYVKVRERASWDFALVSVAAAGTIDGAAVTNVWLGMGGVAAVPWRSEAAQAILGQGPATDARVSQAIEAVLTEASPLAENAFKKDLLAAAIRDAVAALANRTPA